MSTITISQQRRTVLADVIASSLLSEIALVVGGALLVGILAQISIHLSFTPVPITGQTLGVMLCGSALGWRRAGAAMSLYVLAGALGVRWFAGFTSGHPMATFGYLIGFVIAGPILGWIASRGGDRKVSRALFSMLVGDFIIFLIAVPWLAVAIHVPLSTAITDGFTPYIGVELIKVAVAGVALPTSWRVVDRATKGRG